MLFETYPLKDCRDRANHAPATNTKKVLPGPFFNLSYVGHSVAFTTPIVPVRPDAAPGSPSDLLACAICP